MPYSQFPQIFQNSDDIYRALREIVRADVRKDGSIDPWDVVRKVWQTRPNIPIADIALLDEVVKAAREVGVPLASDARKVKSPTDSGLPLRHEESSRSRAAEIDSVRSQQRPTASGDE